MNPLPTSGRATLRDVALRAGVHQTTVSLALRDHPRIPLPTRARIKEAAHALGYRVNPLVAALMSARRLRAASGPVVLAWVGPQPTGDGPRAGPAAECQRFAGAKARAEQRGYKLERLWFGEPDITPVRLGEILRARGIRGVLFERSPPAVREGFPYEFVSCVALGLAVFGPPLHRVAEDHFDSAGLAFERCRARGYRRVGFAIADTDACPAVTERWLGAVGGHVLGLPTDERLAPFRGTTSAAVEAEFAHWLEVQRPDVVIATRGAPVRRWLEALRCNVPLDVGLAALDATGARESAGVRCDQARLGELAVEMLVNLMHRNRTGPAATAREELLLKGVWRDGTSLPSGATTAGRAVAAAR